MVKSQSDWLSSPKITAGTSRQMPGGKRHGDVLEDVPSDESDEERNKRKRPRVRPRKESVYRDRVTKALPKTLYKERGKETPVGDLQRRHSFLVPQLPSSQHRQIVQGSDPAGSSAPLNSSRLNNNQVSQENGAVSVMPSTSQRLRRRRSRITAQSGSETGSSNGTGGWVFFSIWMPHWEQLLKCEGDVLLVESERFKKEVLEIIRNISSLPDHYKDCSVRASRVQNTEQNDNTRNEGRSIVMRKVAFRDDPPLSKSGVEVQLKPSDGVTAGILGKLVTSGDIVLHFVPPETWRGSVSGLFIVHLTSRKYETCLLNWRGTQGKIFINEGSGFHDQYYFKILTVYSGNFQWPTTGDIRTGIRHGIPPLQQNPVATSSRGAVDENLVTANSANSDLQIKRQRSERIQTRNTNQVVNAEEVQINNPSPETRDHVDQDMDVDIEESETENDMQAPVATPAPRVAITAAAPIVEVEDLDVEDEEGIHSVINNDTDSFNTTRRPIIDIEELARECNFLPGPMRPKLRKIDTTNNYVYHKLEELSNLLKASMQEEAKDKDKPVSSQVKHPCNAYGVVTKVMTENRRDNSYNIRVSDESVYPNSVLTRLHTIKTQGPVIEVGDIIRIHRLKVQIEWDSEMANNTMVLSSPVHHNYVSFRKCSEKESGFNIYTCANSITLADSDRRRIAEMHRFKITRCNQITSCDGQSSVLNDLNANHRGVNSSRDPAHSDAADNYNICTVNSSDGILANELESPHIDNCSEDINNFLNNDEDEIQVIEIRQPNSTSREKEAFSQREIVEASSEDSFETALESINSDSNASPRIESVAGEGSQAEPAELAEGVSPLENFLQQGRSLPLRQGHRQGYTRFVNLKKTLPNEKITLMCTVDAVCGSSDLWHAVLKDGEATLPPNDFKIRGLPFLNSEMIDTHLVLKITGNKRNNREVVATLQDAVGSEEMRVIENIEVKGNQPPYSLEVDGSVLIVRPATDEDLCLDMDWTLTEDEDQGNVSMEILALATPDKSTVTPGHEQRVSESPWDGKLRRRRRPRQHYQKEDSFEC